MPINLAIFLSDNEYIIIQIFASPECPLFLYTSFMNETRTIEAYTLYCTLDTAGESCGILLKIKK